MNLIYELRDIAFIFSQRDKKRLVYVAIIQILLSMLDLIGVALVGVIGAITIYGVQSKSAGNRVLSVLEFLNLDSLSFQNQVAYLGIIAVLVFIIKTISSIFLTRRTLLFISRRGALISANLVQSLFTKSISHLNKYTHQELIYVATNGIEIMTSRVIGSALIVVTDLALLIVLLVGLTALSPSISISILIVFATLGLTVNNLMKNKAFKLGSEEVLLGVKSNEKISEVLNTYRESVVRNRRYHYINIIRNLRFNLATVTAERYFMPNLNKYIMETSIIVAALFVSGVQFAINDSTKAIANLTVFLAASTRIAPAILRIQQGTLLIRSGLGSVGRTIEIIRDSQAGVSQEIIDTQPDFDYKDFEASIRINNLNYAYSENHQFKLQDINLEVKTGQHLAISGSSGAGKTTLVDLILGVLSPTSGYIEISGAAPLTAFDRWPGATGYVPQDISIVNGTIWENIALGFNHQQNHEPFIWRALKLAQLDKYIEGLPDGLFTEVGEKGFKLSGGQRQRLGIARALFTQPKLLVLDEATSALDGATESDIASAIKSLKGKVTVILIAHRLSSVRDADQVVFMSGGKIEAYGTFDEVRRIAPDFDKQANLMGL
jgi:ABC-type branched-subunit amino acid transport system ATPase component